jgi:hypothetical protein
MVGIRTMGICPELCTHRVHNSEGATALPIGTLSAHIIPSCDNVMSIKRWWGEPCE